MPASPRVWYARCPSCGAKVRQGSSCDHISLNDAGQVYEIHAQHQFEPANHAEVWFEIESAKVEV